jgi:hypothetical protein
LVASQARCTGRSCRTGIPWGAALTIAHERQALGHHPRGFAELAERFLAHLDDRSLRLALHLSNCSRCLRLHQRELARPNALLFG